MHTVTSKDGTKIAYDRQGQGASLILVDGAMTARSSNTKPQLVNLLADHFTVYSYDRRGRGDSGDTLPYAVEREIEDIEALITEAGGTAFLYGHSSGAALALEATLKPDGRIKKLALYEAPYNDEAGAQTAWHEYITKLTGLLAADRRDEAVELFMGLVGVPEGALEGLRHSPDWPGLIAIAPTLAYDHTALLGEYNTIPTEKAARVKVPTLVMSGAKSFPFMGTTALTLSKVIPGAKLQTLAGQDHNVAPEALAPVLVEFFNL